MYEIEDYEDKISKHRKILWLFSFVIFLGYLFCAGYAYNGAQTTDGGPWRAYRLGNLWTCELHFDPQQRARAIPTNPHAPLSHVCMLSLRETFLPS